MVRDMPLLVEARANCSARLMVRVKVSCVGDGGRAGQGRGGPQ